MILYSFNSNYFKDYIKKKILDGRNLAKIAFPVINFPSVLAFLSPDKYNYMFGTCKCYLLTTFFAQNMVFVIFLFEGFCADWFHNDKI